MNCPGIWYGFDSMLPKAMYVLKIGHRPGVTVLMFAPIQYDPIDPDELYVRFTEEVANWCADSLIGACMPEVDDGKPFSQRIIFTRDTDLVLFKLRWM